MGTTRFARTPTGPHDFPATKRRLAHAHRRYRTIRAISALRRTIRRPHGSKPPAGRP
jgi:hypothetical protein